MRLNNYISSTGFCSRRAADELIKKKCVKINGIIAELGTPVNEGDVVTVNGKKMNLQNNKIYIAFNKPVGITCTTERHIAGNIIDFINHKERIFPIGRLDKESEGLILLTNDGSIVNEILRSENNHEKDYIVTVNRSITQDFIHSMSKGVTIYNPVQKKHMKTKPCKVVKINDHTFKITLSQGLNRQIRRMCEQFDYEVVRLKRIRIINIEIKDLKVGKWRYLSQDEVMNLLKK